MQHPSKYDSSGTVRHDETPKKARTESLKGDQHPEYALATTADHGHLEGVGLKGLGVINTVGGSKTVAEEKAGPTEMNQLSEYTLFTSPTVSTITTFTKTQQKALESEEFLRLSSNSEDNKEFAQVSNIQTYLQFRTPVYKRCHRQKTGLRVVE